MADSKADFMKKMGKYKKAYKEARTVDAGGSFSTPEMEDGSYEAKLTSVKAGVDKSDVPYVSLQFVVTKGPAKGERPSIYHGMRNEDSIEYLVKDCKRLGIETDEMELDETIDALLELASEKPLVKIDVKNNEYKATKGPNKGKKVNALNVYVGKILQESEEVDDDDDEEEDDDVENEDEGTDDGEEDSDDTDDGDSESDEDDSEDDEDEDDDDDEDVTPEKGNLVKHKAKGSRKATEFTVTKVNSKASTVDLKDAKGKTIKGVPFDAVEIVYDDNE